MFHNSRPNDGMDRPRSLFRVALMTIAALPALVIGVAVMRRSGVSSAIWGAQLAAGLVLMSACMSASLAARRIRKPGRSAVLIGGAALLLLAGTCAHAGVQGVHRWISAGPLELHAAFIALPVLLMVLCAIRRAESDGRERWAFPFGGVIAAGLLLLQPDASQASAFAIATVLILLERGRANPTSWATGAVVVGAAALTWSRPDTLDAVPHVEGIIHLAANLGAGWAIASAVALALLPLSFLALAGGGQRPEGLALAAYFGIACVMPLVGPYPVPILGFGLSPLLGYFLALGWIIVKNASDWRYETAV